MVLLRKTVEVEVPQHAVKANELLDLICKTYHLKNDAALCRFLQVAPPIVSKLRHGHYGVSSEMVIRIHEITGWMISDIKKYLGLPSVADH